jgi:uncharacterized membrane protein YphA (DoxX/SURF4 family)
MKTTRIIYWTLTALASAFMIMSAIPDVAYAPEATDIFKHLGYPVYLLPFIGTLKILGAIAILIPRFPKIKEWAYTGLVFDLVGAAYSHISVGDGASVWSFAIIGLALVGSSYVFYLKKETSK